MNATLGRRLLVPMNIEALVIGADPATDWVNLKPAFLSVFIDNWVLGQQLENEACSTTDAGLNQEAGIHLHWALPDGLTHGVARGGGKEPEFPLIPNRWLVVRLWDSAGPTEAPNLQFKAWIVESDTITGDDTGAIWPTLRSEHPDPANQQDYVVNVGRSFELGAWPGETAAPSVEITAIGYGDPSFAASYPAARGILGFRDSDVANLEDVDLTYFVAGWYSQPDKDPLHRALSDRSIQARPTPFGRMDDFLGRTRWIYPGYAEAAAKIQRAAEVDTDLKEATEMTERIRTSRPEATDALAELQKRITALDTERGTLSGQVAALIADLPDQIVCHGIVSGIRWEKSDTLYDTGIPRGKPFSVAVGNTAVEALAALFQTKLDAGVSKLLEAFQYDLLADLEKPGGEDKFEQKVHERRFRPLSRGIRWDLIQDAPIATGASANESTPPIPGDVRVLLENVNILQRQINLLKRRRDARKSELYATWYKKVLTPGVTALTQQMTALQGEIDALSSQITTLENAADGRPASLQWDDLKAKLATFLPGCQLTSLEEPRFWRPNDPVVLLAGPAFQRSSRHGEDGRYRSDGSLLCRLSGQEFTGINVSIPNAKIPQVQFGPADVDQWGSPFAGAGNGALATGVRESVRSLIEEALLLTLDEKRARQVASAAYEKNEAGLAARNQPQVNQLATALLAYLKQRLEDAQEIDSEAKAPSATPGAFTTAGVWPSPIATNTWLTNPWLPLFLQWQVTWTPSYSDTPRALENWTLNVAGSAFDEKAGSSGAAQVYGGTALLTPGATQHLSERLRQYNLTHDSAPLRTLQTTVGSMNLLCQTLGGLTENLLMRKARLEIRPLDPGPDGSGPTPSPVFDRVSDIDWLSPLTDAAFFPVRAGHLSLEKLWIIDAFGQVLQLETERAAAALQQPLVHERLAGAAGDISLEPRLAQPARLNVEWPPANRWKPGDQAASLGESEAADPVCGWIVPNLLDRGLMIYDARGRALGSLQAVQRKSWDQRVGARQDEVESFHWVDIPGSARFFFGKPRTQIVDPLGSDANPHLREYVRGLLSLTGESGAAFGQLLDKMNEALSTGGGGSSSRNPGLSLLIGKPLALVRATIRLELDGDPALSQGSADVQKDAKDRTGRIEQLKIRVRLGDRRQWNGLWLGDDGLAGFFLNEDYSRFYPAYGLQGRDNAYSTHNWTPEISIAEPLDVTLLMDPSQGVCATTGILPRVVFTPPYGDVAEALENSLVVFFTGPLISTTAAIRMPQPSDLYGQWSWTHHPAVQVWKEDEITDTRKEAGQFFDEALQIAEGWLKLVPAPVAVRTFTVKGMEPVAKEQKAAKKDDPPIPARFEVPADASLVLSWAAVGADAIELKAGETLLVASSRHPLPTQCRVEITQSTSFTLTAFGRAEQPAGSQDTTRQVAKKTIDIRVVAKGR